VVAVVDAVVDVSGPQENPFAHALLTMTGQLSGHVSPTIWHALQGPGLSSDGVSGDGQVSKDAPHWNTSGPLAGPVQSQQVWVVLFWSLTSSQ